MECFTHPGSSSVGICKTCGKAVCRTCAIGLGFAVACTQACATEAAAIHEMNQRGKKIYGIGVARPKIPSGVIMWLLFGALFSGFGAFAWFKARDLGWFLLLFGAASFFVAWLGYRRAKDVGLQC